jgi:hypothetical protein
VEKKFIARAEVINLRMSQRVIMPLVRSRIKSGPRSALLVGIAKTLIGLNARLVDTEMSADSRMRTVLVFATTGTGALQAAYHHARKNAHPGVTLCIIARAGLGMSVPMGIQYRDKEAVPLGLDVGHVHLNIRAKVESVTRSLSGLITFVNIIPREIRCMCVK